MRTTTGFSSHAKTSAISDDTLGCFKLLVALNSPLGSNPQEIWHYQRYKQFRNPKAVRLTMNLSTAGEVVAC